MKYEDITEGMYIQFYASSNVYMVYSDNGRLYIQGRTIPYLYLDNVKKWIYKAFTFEEIENVGTKIQLEVPKITFVDNL